MITSVTKAGGSEFHGIGFFSARNYALNSNDCAIPTPSGLQKPQNKYYYPGGNIGGPVLIPGTNFNKNRDKLFFFTGYEYFYQVLDTGLLTARYRPPGCSTATSRLPNSRRLGNNHGCSGKPPGTSTGDPWYPGGIMPPILIDPNMQALMNLYPAPNANPERYRRF